MKLNEAAPALRQLVSQAFRELGASDAELSAMRDTILIREGNYCGRSFRVGRWFAMWMSVGNVITFYDEDGTILRMLHPTEIFEPQRRVA